MSAEAFEKKHEDKKPKHTPEEDEVLEESTSTPADAEDGDSDGGEPKPGHLCFTIQTIRATISETIPPIRMFILTKRRLSLWWIYFSRVVTRSSRLLVLMVMAGLPLPWYMSFSRRSSRLTDPFDTSVTS